MKTTVNGFIAAIRRNGYKQSKGSFVRYDADGKVESACALGQAGLNLNKNPNELLEKFEKFLVLNRLPYINIIGLNDYKGLTCAQIADAIEDSISAELRNQSLYS